MEAGGVVEGCGDVVTYTAGHITTARVVIYGRVLKRFGYRSSRLEVARWKPWADRFLLGRDHPIRTGELVRRSGP